MWVSSATGLGSSMMPSAIASRTISLMRAMLLASSMARNVCQPSTTGPSKGTMRWHLGFQRRFEEAVKSGGEVASPHRLVPDGGGGE